MSARAAILLGVGLLGLVVSLRAAAAGATPPAAAAATAATRPEPEYRVSFGARDPFVPVTRGAAQAAVAPRPVAVGRIDAQVAAVAAQIRLTGIAAGPGGVDLAILNGALVQAGQTFKVRSESGEEDVMVLRIRKEPPQVTLRWGEHEFVRAVGGEKGVGP
jgi:hypothetical protein